MSFWGWGLRLGGRRGGGVAAAPWVADIYVDSVAGDDANDGLTEGTAFATMSRLDTELAADPTINVALKRGSRFAPLVLGFGRGVQGQWQAHGTGTLPFIDCSLPVTVGDITAHGTHDNVYVVEITHATAPFYTNSVGSNGPHVGLWWETAGSGILGQYLAPIFGGADIATQEAFVRDNPGRCFVHKVGSTTTDVRLETTGSVLRYVFHLADSSNPASGGTLRYANYHDAGLNFQSGAQITGLMFGRNTRKDCVAADNDVTTNIPLPVFTDCAWIDPGCHAIVGPSNWRRNVAYSRTPGSIVGGAWHNFSSAVDPRSPDIEDSYIRGFNHAVYSHGSGQSPVLNTMTARRLRIEACVSGFTTPALAVPALFEDIILLNVGNLMAGNGDTLRRFYAQFRRFFNEATVFSFSGGTVEDGFMERETNTPGESYSIAGLNMTTQEQAEAFGSPVLRRITYKGIGPGGFARQASTQRWITATIEDCALAATVFTNDKDATVFLAASTISNSYIGPVKNASLPLFDNLAEYQERVPGVANDVIMYNGSEGNTVTIANADAFIDASISGPAAILGKGMGVDPAIITGLPTTLENVPTLASMGLTP